MGQLCNEWFGDTVYYNIHVPLNLENIHGSEYFLYLGQDEISSDLGFIKGKVDSILSDTDVTVQVRTVHFFNIRTPFSAFSIKDKKYMYMHKCMYMYTYKNTRRTVCSVFEYFFMLPCFVKITFVVFHPFHQ